MSEMISLLLRADWEIRPASYFQDPLLSIGEVERNGGNPELLINRRWLPELAVDPARLYFYLVHELIHATRSGWQHRQGPPGEVATNDVTAAVLTRLGKVVDRRNEFGTTDVTYNPNTPGT